MLFILFNLHKTSQHLIKSITSNLPYTIERCFEDFLLWFVELGPSVTLITTVAITFLW